MAGGREGDPPCKSHLAEEGAVAADRSHLPRDGAARSSRAGGCSSPGVAAAGVGGSPVAEGGGGDEVAGTGTDPADLQAVVGVRSSRAAAGMHPEAGTGPGTDRPRGV